MPTSNERKMLSSNEALKELKLITFSVHVYQALKCKIQFKLMSNINFITPVIFVITQLCLQKNGEYSIKIKTLSVALLEVG